MKNSGIFSETSLNLLLVRIIVWMSLDEILFYRNARRDFPCAVYNYFRLNINTLHGIGFIYFVF